MEPLTLTLPSFPRVADYAGGWAIEPEAAAALVNAAQRIDWAAHMAAPRSAPESTVEKIAAGDGKTIAMVRLQGLLMKQQSSFGSSTSTVQARRDIRAAASDPQVSAILVAIDSPGGTVAGTESLANDIRDARKAKPVYAQIEDLGASAAYWAASQAEKVFATNRTTLVGSIGAMNVVYDDSAAHEKGGVKVHLFKTGPMKGVGTPGTAVDDAHREYLQRSIENLQAPFDDAVQTGRKFSAQQLAAVKSGGVFTADEAQRLGLVDGVQSIEATIAQLSGRSAKSSPTYAAPSGPGVSAMTFEQYVASFGLDAKALSETQSTAFRANYDATQKVAVAPLAKPAAGGDGASLMGDLETKMAWQADVQAACQEFGNPRVEWNGVTQTLYQHAVKNKLDLAVVRQLGELAKLRDRPEHAGVAVGNPLNQYAGGNGPNFVFPKPASTTAIEAALCLSVGIPEAQCGKWFGEAVMNRAMRPDVRGTKLSHLVFAALAAAGVHARPGAVDDVLIARAIQADKTQLLPRWNQEKHLAGGEPLMADGGTTLSLSGILSNVANKAAANAYQLQSVVWRMFCAVRTHNDFKTATRYRMDSTGAVKKVGPDGELKHVGLAETSFTNRLDTYGGIITLNRQMWINDDLGMFTQLPAMLGYLTAIRLEELFFVTLLGNANSFYGSGNKNLITGSTGAMTAANGISAITLAETKFGNQVDLGGKPILNPPNRILCGTVNYVPALQVYENRIKITGENATQVAGNEHAGKYQPTKSPYMNNTAIKDQDGNAITGQSDTLWYLFADPAIRPSYGAAFLNGNEAPTLMSEATEFGTLGFSWEVFHDFGIGQEDPNGSIKINGA